MRKNRLHDRLVARRHDGFFTRVRRLRRDAVGHCDVCGRGVHDRSEAVRVPGNGLVHRDCATYRRDGSHVPHSLRERDAS